MSTCPDCGHESEGNFCPECGINKSEAAAKPRFCAKCGTELQAGVKFCKECGASLVEETPTSSATRGSGVQSGITQIQSAELESGHDSMSKTRGKGGSGKESGISPERDFHARGDSIDRPKWISIAGIIILFVIVLSAYESCYEETEEERKARELREKGLEMMKRGFDELEDAIDQIPDN